VVESLKKVPGSEIDYSDIPPLRDRFWKNAVRGPLFGRQAIPLPNKQQVTIRLDADVFAWLRGHGKGYQTRLNALLRQVMDAERNGPGLG